MNDSRAMLTVYSNPSCPYSHRTRIALLEKQIEANIIQVSEHEILPEDVCAATPFNTLPIITDRDVTLYDSYVITQYFDERYPLPTLLPTDPVQRAQARLMLHRMDSEWYSLLPNLEADKPRAKKTLQEDLIVLAPIFAETPYFMSESFSILDCWLAPLLWRLPLFNIKLPDKAKAVENYAQRIFNRDSFSASLSLIEKNMR
jgi:RNA polymerase-associated protein